MDKPRTIEIQGLDANYEIVTETVTVPDPVYMSQLERIAEALVRIADLLGALTIELEKK